MGARRFAFALVLLTLVAWPSTAVAQTDDVIEETIGVYLLRVSDFDPGTGRFVADIYLQITCDRACDPQPEIVNGHVLEQMLYEGATDTYHAWRIRAELEQDVDLRRFPFDEGELPVHIEDGLQDVTQMVYVVDETSDVDSAVSLPSHRLDENWQARVVEHPYPFFDQTYSRFIFSVRYSSPIPSTIVKDLLPAALIALYGFLSFVMRPGAEASRYVVSTSALVALVFYGANLTGDIPKTDYLTFADKYVLLTIFALLLALGSNIAIANEGRDRARPEVMASINRYAGFGTVGIWIVLQVLATISML